VTPAAVLLAESTPVVRAAVRTLVAEADDLTLVEAKDAAEAFAAIEQHAFDVALIDDLLRPSGAMRVVRALRASGCEDVIVWSFEPDRDQVFAAICAGATGYLPKEIASAGLLAALRAAVRGEAALPRDLVALVIEALHDFEGMRRQRELAGALSGREREVLGHIAHGRRNKQIADSLSISEFTVKRHVQNILHKLDVASRRDAAAYYRLALTEDVAAG
jgi:DNA-binding NarL/FixJ family response regulator